MRQPHGTTSLMLMFRFSHDRGRHATASMDPSSMWFLNSRTHFGSLRTCASALGFEIYKRDSLCTVGVVSNGPLRTTIYRVMGTEGLCCLDTQIVIPWKQHTYQRSKPSFMQSMSAFLRNPELHWKIHLAYRASGNSYVKSVYLKLQLLFRSGYRRNRVSLNC